MTIRELLDRFRSVVDESASETAKALGDFLDVLFFEVNWMDAHWLYVVSAVALYSYLGVGLTNVLRRWVASDRDTITTDLVVISAVGLVIFLVALA